MINLQYDDIIISALKEDMPQGDITTDNIICEKMTATAEFTVKEEGLICGIGVAKRVFELLDDDVVFEALSKDGERVKPGEIVIRVTGNARALLKAERTALNFLQRMSGISTETYKHVQIIQGSSTKIVDTRKTTPGHRYLEKYAVKCGGGSNHRFSLSDGVLIKDNHIKAAGGIKEAVTAVRGNIPHTIKIEVETEDLDMVKEAVEAKADIIMLDNMNIEEMSEAVKYINGRALTEASGDMNEEKLKKVSEIGVDIISIGKITKSAYSMDISMNFIS